MPPTTYCTVVVTRNRPAALALSLPLMLAQSRLPERIVVIDSSDDPAANVALTAGLDARAPMPVRHIVSPPGMTVQRNIGLAEVSSDVVFFPDDDSLLLPGAMAAIMRVYDTDTGGRVGGVCSAEARRPPEGVLSDGGRASYAMTPADRFKSRIARTRFALEDRFLPDPFFLVAARKYARQGIAEGAPPPGWMAAQNAIFVPWMSGFRMSFRTDAIRRHGFNEHLGRYALFEDTVACFAVLQDHLLVGARDAQIYHHKAPARRANGRALGAMQLLNRTYALALSGEADARMRAVNRRYATYKIAQYAAAARSGFGRDRLAGARCAAAVMDRLFGVAPHEATALYLTLRAGCFDGEG